MLLTRCYHALSVARAQIQAQIVSTFAQYCILLPIAVQVLYQTVFVAPQSAFRKIYLTFCHTRARVAIAPPYCALREMLHILLLYVYTFQHFFTSCYMLSQPQVVCQVFYNQKL